MSIREAVAAEATEAAMDGHGHADRPMRLEELLRLVPLQLVSGPRDVAVSGVSIDSRAVRPGHLFVAVRGEKFDGNDYVDDALARGAVGIVSEMSPPSRWEARATWVQTPEARNAAGILSAAVHKDPSSKLGLVGITGTNGKTTTAYLVDGLLERLAPPSAMLGTVVAKLGNQATPTRLTTPEAPAIQEFLARAVASGARYGVLEVSSHGLELERLAGTEFRVAVFTNLSRDHLDFHRDMEAYFRAKRRLFTRHLAPDGSAVIRIDGAYGAYGERLAAELGAKAVTFGRSDGADLALTELDASLDGLRIVCQEGTRTFELRSPLLAHYNAFNLVAAFAAVRALGFEEDAILPLLPSLEGAPGRFERVAVSRPFDVIVDYAHTDDALRKLLEAARPLTRGRLIVVFGCGGERDRAKRPLMGDVAARIADRVVITSDNPRGEDPEAIVREIQLGTKDSRATVTAEVDRREAIRLALAEAREGDVVVVAGKGHEPYQIIGDRVLEFDDRLVVRELAGGGPS